MLVACAAVLAVLVGAQVFLFHRTHRVFNVPLAAASLVVVVLMVWAAVAMASAQDALARAQRDGSDAVQVLSAARILGCARRPTRASRWSRAAAANQYASDFDT